MQALIKRNLLLYFRDKAGVVFSVLGALISFILYLIFLKETIASEWSHLPQSNQLLDTWLISGTLSITSMTTTFASLTQLVKDRETKVRQDLLLADINAIRLHLSYLLSAALIGVIMQVLLFGVMFSYFYFMNQTVFSLSQLISTFVLMVFSSLLAATLNLIFIQQLKTVDSAGRLGSIIGTSAGFLVGSYVPIGALPSFAQLLMKLTPGSYVASLYRQILLSPTLTGIFKETSSTRETFEEAMGIRLKFSKLLSFQQTCIILVVIFITALFIILFFQWTSSNKKCHVLFRQ